MAIFDNLDSAIESAIDQYSDDRRYDWNEDEESRRTVHIADKLASLLHDASSELAPPNADIDSSGWELVRELITETGFWPLVKERLQIHLAWKVAPYTDEMAERCRDLTAVVFFDRPSERVLKYVRRLSSCYIAGFLPECVVLSRAVMERALKDSYQYHNVPYPPGLNLEKLINDVHLRGWLSERGRVKAHDVRHRGNKAVHEDPELVEDVRDTVHAALQVIGEVFKAA
jgi:hypothetical protein